MQEAKEETQKARTIGATQHKTQMRTKARKRRAKALKKARNEEYGSLPKHICRCKHAKSDSGGHPSRNTKEQGKNNEKEEKKNKSPNGPSKRGQKLGGDYVPGRGGLSGLPQGRRDGQGSETA